MSEKIKTLHPLGKQGTNIDREKYDAICSAIIGILQERGEMPFSKLAPAIEERLPDFDGSIGWYSTTVKLDLEARDEIERVAGSTPQRLRLKS